MAPTRAIWRPRPRGEEDQLCDRLSSGTIGTPTARLGVSVTRSDLRVIAGMVLVMILAA